MNSVAATWLNENIVALASDVTHAHFERHPEIRQRYGPCGRERCTQDAAYHLHFLAEAVLVQSPPIFLNYIAWAKIMLASRGIESEELEEYLIVIREVLTQNAALHQSIFAEFLNAAIEALPQFPITVPSFLSGRPFSEIGDKFFASLLALDRENAQRVVLEEIDQGLSVMDLFEHILFPVQQEVGRLWQQNQISVLQEHYCTAAIETLITHLRRTYLGLKRNATAMGLCPGEEHHCIGLRMYTELLEADGWTVLYFGPNSPISDSVRFIGTQHVDLLAISVTLSVHLSAARELIALMRSSRKGHREPRVIIGGAALAADPELWKMLGADAYSRSLADGLDEANRLITES